MRYYQAADFDSNRSRPDRKFRVSRTFWIGLSYSCGALVVVLALLWPSVLRKAERRRALQTMADLRTIGTAVEAYAIDQGGYPYLRELVSSGHSYSDPREASPWRWRRPSAWPVQIEQRLDGLQKILSPRYVNRLPVKDRWGHPFLYVTTPDRQHYTITSTGPDGQLATVHRGAWYGESDMDLVYADGSFREWLEGT